MGENVLYGGDIGADSEICEHSKSLGELLLRKFQEAGDKVLLVDGITGQKLTAFDLRTETIRLATCLQKSFNIKCGDTIGICSENRLEFAYTLHATLLLGATLAPFNVTYTEREIHHALNLSKPKVIFVSLHNLDKFVSVRSQNPFIQQIIVYDDIETNVSKIVATKNVTTFRRFNDTVKGIQTDTFICEPQNMKENVSLILCSSGTTGLPKGVQITQFNLLVANIQHYKRPHKSEDDLSDERIILGILPWFHAFGMTLFIVMAIRTTKIVFLPKFEEIHFLRCIQIYKANTVYLVPPIMVLLTKSALVDQYNLSSLKVIWCGAAPLSKQIEYDVKQRIGVKVIRQGYGMTEGTLALCGQNDDHHTSGSVGVLRCGVYGRVIDTDTGTTLNAYGLGEIQFKSSCLMKGYIGNEQETSATIDNNGWLHTGDIGFYDKNGEWFIVDRIKELIKYKGYQVPPAEIEGILLTNENVKDVGVIGVPDELAGELALAFVVKQPNATISEKEIIQFVADRVSAPKRLHGGVRFVSEIPKNPSGKILRRILREMIKEQKCKL